MCGRYYIMEEMEMELELLTNNAAKTKNLISKDYIRNIAPSAIAPVIIGRNQEIAIELLSWGFQGYDKKGLIINARAETVMEKRTFSECFYTRRCVVPAVGFYEWDKSKNKFTFTDEQNKVMLMAGLYDEEGRFVIITTKANESMEPVHDRMPLVLSKQMLEPWLFDTKEAANIIKEASPLLKRHTDMEQMRLEFF